MATGTRLLADLSRQLADAIEVVAPSVVRVDDGTRLTATGLVWSADGVIVSTSHGVERDEELAIETADGHRHAATMVGRDSDTDIAVLRVSDGPLSAIAQADDADARIGHLALAVGRPGSAGLQATIGIIGARLETQTGGQPGYLLHTDAVLYPGFSGGALVSVDGRLLGMTNLLYGHGRGVAIGAPVVKQVVDHLLAHGRVRRGYLGVRTQLVRLPESAGQSQGLLVVQVEPGSPAECDGLLLGDTLLSIGDRLVEDVDELRAALRNLVAGQTAALRILRGGVIQDAQVILGEAE